MPASCMDFRSRRMPLSLTQPYIQYQKVQGLVVSVADIVAVQTIVIRMRSVFFIQTRVLRNRHVTLLPNRAGLRDH